MSLDARRTILKSLESGAKTPDELRDKCLGQRPKETEKQTEYATKYQAYRRALESLVTEGVIEQSKYRLTEEEADQRYIRASIKRFEETDDATRHHILMEDIEAECRKREVISTPRLLIFIEQRLLDETEEVRKLAISCLRYMTSRIDESRREDAKYLKRMKTDYANRLLEIASENSSIEMRIEALKLLTELGEPRAISVIEDIVANSPPEIFGQFKFIFKAEICNRYDENAFSKNRLVRDYKDRLRNMLADLSVKVENDQTRKRAEFLLWQLRYGRTNTMSGEQEIK